MKKKKYKFKKQKKKISWVYIVTITLSTFIIAVFMQSATQILIENISILYAFIALVFVVLIGIVADILGVAVTTADETPFHAMAADKVKGAKETIALIKNAEKVSNIANDVIGDVCSVISGGVASFIVAELILIGISNNSYFLSIALTGLVSAITVGGKALGKFIAITSCNNIVFAAGRTASFFKFTKRNKQ